MRYSLRDLWRRTRNPRRRIVVLRQVIIPATMATDLYRSGYSDVVETWSAALAPIMATYEQSLSELTQDAPQDVGAVISNVEASVSAVILTVRARLQRWAERVEALHRRKWRGAVLSATGVDINTLIGPADMRAPISAVIEENVGLIRSVSDQARDRISVEVFEGLRQRKPAREVAASIREKVEMGRRRALNIAADQTNKLAAALNEERAREAGLDHYEWVHSGKRHPRLEHLARNGKRFEYGKPDGDAPGYAPFCGCTSRAVLSLDDEF